MNPFKSFHIKHNRFAYEMRWTSIHQVEHKIVITLQPKRKETLYKLLNTWVRLESGRTESGLPDGREPLQFRHRNDRHLATTLRILIELWIRCSTILPTKALCVRVRYFVKLEEFFLIFLLLSHIHTLGRLATRIMINRIFIYPNVIDNVYFKINLELCRNIFFIRSAKVEVQYQKPRDLI